MAHDDPVKQQAVNWAVRTSDPEFEDWEGFTAWLEGDPARSEAYDRVILATAEAAEADFPAPEAANDDEEAHAAPVRRRWLGGAVAACLAFALLGVWQLRDDSYLVATAPGEIRTVALADGSAIALSGGTRIVLDRDDPREARLETGQALFTIRHDPAEPFRVEVGEDTLVDLGTVFDVRHTPRATTVAVSEGVVLFNPDGQNVRLSPGDVLSSPTGSEQYRLGHVPVAQVGEWREGRLSFQDATLAEVAAELTRTTGISFQAAPGTGGRSFSGSIMLGPVRGDPRSLGPLLGAEVRPDDQGWIIEAP